MVVNAAYTAPPVTVDMSISPAQIVAGNSAALTLVDGERVGLHCVGVLERQRTVVGSRREHGHPHDTRRVFVHAVLYRRWRRR